MAVSYTHLDVYKRQRISGLLNKADVLADLFDGLFLALIEDDLVLFEQVAACLLYTSRCV